MDRHGSSLTVVCDATELSACQRHAFSLPHGGIRVALSTLCIALSALCIALMAGLAITPWAGGLRTWVVGEVGPRDPVYTVGVVRAGLTHDAAAWIGRPLRVQGQVIPCLAVPSVGEAPCLALAPRSWPRAGVALSDPTALLPVPLQWAPAPSWLPRLRRLPLVASLLPAP